jgi:hypothetical protein
LLCRMRSGCPFEERMRLPLWLVDGTGGGVAQEGMEFEGGCALEVSWSAI